MRHPVRPFVKAYKNRSSKSLTPHQGVNGGQDNPKQSFPTGSAIAPSEVNHDDTRKAALKAADAVFGKNSSEVPYPEKAPSSNPSAPVGRVLPSLVQEDDALTVRLREAAEKSHSARRVNKTRNLSSILRNKTALQSKSKLAKAPIEQSAKESSTRSFGRFDATSRT